MVGKNQNQPKDNTVDNNQNDEDDDGLVVDSNERYRRDELYKSYIAFEKRHGSRENIEILIGYCCSEKRTVQTTTRRVH